MHTQLGHSGSRFSAQLMCGKHKQSCLQVFDCVLHDIHKLAKTKATPSAQHSNARPIYLCLRLATGLLGQINTLRTQLTLLSAIVKR